MGAGNAGSRQDAGPNRTVAMNVNTGQTINEKGRLVGSSFISEGANKSNKDIDKLPFSGTKVVASMFKGPLAKGAKYNREFFVNSVIGNTKKGSNITTTKEEFSKMSASEKENLYSGYTKARQSGTKDAYGRDVIGGGGLNISGATKNPQGIELAKAATGSATILGPAEIQKTAANTTAIKMSAAQTNVANKRKGRKVTNLTAKSALNENYTLSSKSLLG